jgi:hypothetical protein
VSSGNYKGGFMKKPFLPNILEVYVYLPLVTLIIGIYVVFLAEDKYRYECQDPSFWNAPQCNPPICLANGTCTKDLISVDGNYITSMPTSVATVEETVPDYEDLTDPTVCECFEESYKLNEINDIIKEIKPNE